MRSRRPTVLVLQRDEDARSDFMAQVSASGVVERHSDSVADALERVAAGEVDAIICDGRLHGMTHASLVSQVRRHTMTTAIICLQDADWSETGEIVEDWRTRILPRSIAPEHAVEALRAACQPVDRWMAAWTSGKRALVLQDDDSIAGIMRLLLAAQCIPADVTDLGREAIDLARANTYDVMVIDDAVGDMSGYDVIRDIRSHNAATPIYYVSTSQELFGARALQLGANGLIQYGGSWSSQFAEIGKSVWRGRKAA
jgi:DNA-binding response OmpR family regulator